MYDSVETISRPEGRSDIRADVQRRCLCLLLADLDNPSGWHDPLSRRPAGAGQFRICLASLMVTDVGEDARWNVSAGDVGTVLGIAHRAGCDRVWIAGGWGVDALVGRQTRIHSDLDLAVDVTQMALEHLLQAFGRHGYAVEADWRSSRVALTADGARQVDVHPIVFDAQGTGWQANVEGQEPFRYPEDAFAQGLIDGRVVDCLSVSLQLRFHRGYVERERDNHDVALLKPSLDVAAPRRRLPEAAQRSADSRSIIGPRVIVSRMHIVERLREWDFCTDSGAAALRAFHRQRPA
jgi:lincosamide nucleotidyltransferase A/C/D/E